MPYEKISIHNRNLKSRLINIEKNSSISKEEKKQVKEYLRLSSIGKINLRNKISDTRLLKYLDLLIIPLTYFKKDIDKITVREMETFIQDLEKDTLKKKNDGCYSEATKVDIKRIFMSYLKWRIKDSLKYQELTNWIDCSLKKKTPEYLKESEVVKLFNACTTAKQRFLISVLFDAGCRAEELLNIRHEDITEPSQNFSYYKIHFKEEYSKSSGRTIGLYWNHSTGAITDYLSEKKRANPTAPILDDTYDAIRVFISRLGRRVLNKRVHMHLFRHSSATFYAPKMNRQQLCIRYGWKFTSDMPDVYISRAGLEEEEIQEKIHNTNLERLEKENQELQTQFHLLRENLEKDNGKRVGFDDIATKLLTDKEVQKVLLKTMLEKGLGKELMQMHNK